MWAGPIQPRRRDVERRHRPVRLRGLRPRPLGGETHGRETIIGNFAQLPNYWSSFSVEPEEFIDAGDWVVVRGTQRAGNDSGSFDAPFAHLMKFADGKIVRGEFYADSAKGAKLLA